MADTLVLERLRDGGAAWNGWRAGHRDVDLDLSGTDLSGADLRGADLAGAELSRADLRGANLAGANLARARLVDADLRRANLSDARLGEIEAARAAFGEADLRCASLLGANLSHASFYGADLTGSNLSGAQLYRADLRWANLDDTEIAGVNLIDADLYHADLHAARLSDVDLTQARLDLATLVGGCLTRCSVHGVSAWDVWLDGASQSELTITPAGAPAIQVDDLDAALFVNLMLGSRRLAASVTGVEARFALVLTALGADASARLEGLRRALQQEGWMAVVYDIAAADRGERAETLERLAKICPAILVDVDDAGPIAELIDAAARRHGRDPIPLLRSADPEKPAYAGIREIPARLAGL